MSSWMFRKFMQGETIDQIVESSQEPKPTAEHVRESLQRDRKNFENLCLQKVLVNAANGDISAIDWLSRRGLFSSVKLRDEP